jgi:DNA-binding beta-propeller fold protein YncE
MRQDQKRRIGPKLRSVLALACGISWASACTQHGKTNWIYDPGAHWPSRVIVPANVNGFAISTNNLDDTLSWVDLQTLTPVAKLPVGLNAVELEGPHHLLTSPDGQFLYVGLNEVFPSNNAGPHGAHGSGTYPGYVQKIRVSDGTVVGQVRVDRNPGDLVLNAAGTTLYVSHFDVKRILDVTQQGGPETDKYSGIAIIDTATMTRTGLPMVCPAEHGMTLSADETKLYIACYGSDSIAILDLATLTSTIIPAGSPAGELPGSVYYEPYAATLSPDHTKVWFSCWQSHDIREFDIASGAFTGNDLYVGGFPAFGDVWGDRTIVARQSGDPGLPEDKLIVIGSNGGIVASYVYPQSQCVNAHAVRAIPGQPGKALMICEGNHITDGSMLRIDLATGAVEGTAQLGVFPDAVTYVGAP